MAGLRHPNRGAATSSPPSRCAGRGLAKPPAPGLRVRRWSAGHWTDEPDAVVTEEPLQLMLDGEPLSVVMRTPGQGIELCLGLMFAEGILRTLDEVRLPL